MYKLLLIILFLIFTCQCPKDRPTFSTETLESDAKVDDLKSLNKKEKRKTWFKTSFFKSSPKNKISDDKGEASSLVAAQPLFENNPPTDQTIVNQPQIIAAENIPEKENQRSSSEKENLKVSTLQESSLKKSEISDVELEQIEQARKAERQRILKILHPDLHKVTTINDLDRGIPNINDMRKRIKEVKNQMKNWNGEKNSKPYYGYIQQSEGGTPQVTQSPTITYKLRHAEQMRTYFGDWDLKNHVNELGVESATMDKKLSWLYFLNKYFRHQMGDYKFYVTHDDSYKNWGPRQRVPRYYRIPKPNSPQITTIKDLRKRLKEIKEEKKAHIGEEPFKPKYSYTGNYRGKNAKELPQLSQVEKSYYEHLATKADKEIKKKNELKRLQEFKRHMDYLYGDKPDKPVYDYLSRARSELGGDFRRLSIEDALDSETLGAKHFEAAERKNLKRSKSDAGFLKMWKVDDETDYDMKDRVKKLINKYEHLKKQRQISTVYRPRGVRLAKDSIVKKYENEHIPILEKIAYGQEDLVKDQSRIAFYRCALFYVVHTDYSKNHPDGIKEGCCRFLINEKDDVCHIMALQISFMKIEEIKKLRKIVGYKADY